MDEQLLELLIAIEGSSAESLVARWEIRERGPYPPEQDITSTGVRVVSPSRTLAGGSRAVPAEASTAAREAAMRWAESPLGAPMPDALNRAWAVLPFDFPGLDSFLDPGPPPLRRIALELSEPFAALPWEEWMQMLGAPPLNVVRRSGSTEERPVPLDLPITIAVELRTPRVWPGWSSGLFDGFTRTWGLGQGLIELDEAPDRASFAEVRHIVWSSSEGDAAVESVPAWEEGRAPRLVVLHDVAAARHPVRLYRLIATCLDRGADAVLAVAFRYAEPGVFDFFPRFYRDIVHNRPIDFSHAHAWRMVSDFVSDRDEAATLLTVRDGGEFSLLLTRTLTEPTKVAPPPPAARGSRWWGRALLQQRRRQIAQDAAARARQFRLDYEEHPAQVVRHERNYIANEVDEVTAMEWTLAQIDDDRLREGTFRTTNGWITYRPYDDYPYDDYLAAEPPSRPFPGAVPPDEPLYAGRPYWLHVMIGRKNQFSIIAAAFPDPEIARLFARHDDEVELDVAVFSPHFEVIDTPARLRIRRFGDSSVATVGLLPRVGGRAALRICIYHRNVMLQSLKLEVDVIGPGPRSDAVEPPGGGIDYLATGYLAAIDDLQPAQLNVFVNEGVDGTHWIGVFHEHGAALDLRAGTMRTLAPEALETQTRVLRDTLADIQGVKAKYQYAAAWDAVKDDAKAMERRARRIVELAQRGWETFAAVLFAGDVPPGEQVHTLADAHGECLVSVARCTGSSPSVPWAAIYDRVVDTGSGKAKQPALCEVFLDQVRANEWSPEGTLVTKHDLLDDPGACRAQAACPLNGPAARRTVCPLGFWGFAHQVEQPLQQVEPAADGDVPEYARDPRFTQSPYLVRDLGRPVQAVMAVWPKIPDVEAHHQAVAALELDVDYRVDRDEILDLICNGGHHLYYFYCHGELEPKTRKFRLKLGPSDDPGYISHDNLAIPGARWPPPSALVVLNGCETLAVVPEVSHRLMENLRTFGASGVIGTEIKIWTQLAAPFGVGVLERMLDGASLGEAFLAERRHLLRQLNPLGLAYSFYAPASLHLHDEGEASGCAWCAAHLHASAGAG